jgi:CBS domain-containing protein
MIVRDVMTTPVLSVTTDTPLKDVARLLVEKRISGLPVVDASGAVVGVISEADFLVKESGPVEHHSRFGWLTGAARAEAHERQVIAATTAGEAMTTPADVVSADQPLSDAARHMAHAKRNRLPVVENGRLVGILTRADVVRTFARDDDKVFAAVQSATRAIDGLQVLGVRNGVVSLGGVVSHPSVASAVTSLVSHVAGVVAVDATNLSATAEVPVPKTPETVESSGA